MTKLKFLVAAAALFAAPAAAHDSHKHSHSHQTVQRTVQVVVGCYRGPWELVHWDRALPEFYDSLRAMGYSPAVATSIGNRICRDQNLVNNESALRSEALRVISSTPIQ
ncbi:hypothetical protein [uncultured Litoreibacter sp.]|uniref:hypothetical protein n=1 Tax=uncultured Litoreibacter sp. TaxID=1392394 RepID=UPI00260DCF65|nr:hypothetical protein [uncultured Litoreibacter sp.]